MSPSTEKLNAIKEMLGNRYKGVFVKDEDKAARYLEKHDADLVLRVSE